jgi:hypothetical protein
MATPNCIPIAIAAAATLLALACGSRTLDKNDSGSSGLGGGGGVMGEGGAAGAGGGGGAGGTTDGGSCVAVCGRVTGVLADAPGSCAFSLPCSPPLAFTSLAVFVDAVQVPQDATEGWTYAGTQSAFALHGQTCTAVMTSNAPVDVVYLCELP